MLTGEKEFTEKSKSNLSTKDVAKLFTYLLRFWWVFIIIGIAAGLIGIWYASNQKITYKSHLTFALDEGNGNGIGNFLSLASQLGFSVNDAKDIFAGDNIIEIIKSRRMIEETLLSVDTFDNKAYTMIEYFLDISDKRKNNSILENIHFPVGENKLNFTYKQDSVLYKTYLEFANNYVIAQRPDRKLSLFEVNVTSINEKFTKDFTDRLVSETNNYYVQIRTKKTKETLDVLEQRVSSMKENLNSSITKRSEVQDVNVNPAFSAAQVPVLKQQTNIQVYSAAYGEMFKNLELARFTYLNEIPLMQIIDNADYPMEKIKFGKLKAAILFAIFAELLFLGFLALRKIFTS
jgi:uncharacterized protein involved in exopolysaccharide biosynthesis